MKERVFLILFSFMCIPGLVGCATSVGHFSMMATQNVDLSAEYERVATDVVGKNIHWFVLIDPTFSFPRIDAAIDDAVTRSGGDFMTNVQVDYKFFIFPVFYYRFWYEVSGDVWKKKTSGLPTNALRGDPD